MLKAVVLVLVLDAQFLPDRGLTSLVIEAEAEDEDEGNFGNSGP